MSCSHRAVATALLALLACSRPHSGDEALRGAAEATDAARPRVVDAGVAVTAPVTIDAMTVDEELRRRLHKLSSEHGHGVGGAEDWLVAHPDRSRPALVAILRAGEHGFNIHRVLRTLGRIAHPDDIPALRERLFIGYETEVGYAADALRLNPAETAMLALLDALASENVHIVSAGAWALGDRGDERARAGLEALIQHADRAVRSSAIHALQKLGVEPSRALLEARQRVERDAHVKKVLAKVLDSK